MGVPMTVIAAGQKIPKFDAYCPLMSLPYVFKTSINSIPNSVPYLFADQKKVKSWMARLGNHHKKRIGIVWSGSFNHKNDHNRSIPLVELSQLFDLPFEWHSLQKEYRATDKDFLSLHPNIHQHQDELIDFSDTAALIECMDLVICVDTSVAHLAGALGKETWVLLPYAPDYRWMLDRSDSPWYPSIKLFRQDQSWRWDRVINELKLQLNNGDDIQKSSRKILKTSNFSTDVETSSIGNHGDSLGGGGKGLIKLFQEGVLINVLLVRIILKLLRE
jgi:hypothetical protein